jgi:hypothetical protein
LNNLEGTEGTRKPSPGLLGNFAVRETVRENSAALLIKWLRLGTDGRQLEIPEERIVDAGQGTDRTGGSMLVEPVKSWM